MDFRFVDTVEKVAENVSPNVVILATVFLGSEYLPMPPDFLAADDFFPEDLP